LGKYFLSLAISSAILEASTDIVKEMGLDIKNHFDGTNFFRSGGS
jgi:hypothetical protein